MNNIMNVVIPCSGSGTRFKREGFITPKPLIRCMMKPFLCWILDSLRKSKVRDHDVFVAVLSDSNHDAMYQNIASEYDNVNIVYLDKPTMGACETVARAIEKMPPKFMGRKTVCMDCDNFYNVDVLSLCEPENALLTFREESLSCYSFVAADERGTATDIAEKVRISDRALCGVYCFRSGHELYRCATDAISAFLEHPNGGGEVYMSCAVRAGMRSGMTFTCVSVRNEDYVCVGTPSQMLSFYNNLSVVPVGGDDYTGLRVERKRVCFDLDETLVTKPVVDGDYSTCLPIRKNIQLCNYLKRMNHHIIIHTARRMRTHGGNVGAVIADVGRVTLDTLERFGVTYDELLFGKPHADLYIDDKAVNANGDLEKQLGVYGAIDFETRSFNSITVDSFPLIKKSARVGADKDIRSEIYYYKHIPESVKDMFPIFVDHGDDFYRVEQIRGTTLSELYVSGRLTKSTIVALVNSLRRLHESPARDSDDCSPTFYVDKLRERIAHPVYSLLAGDAEADEAGEMERLFADYAYSPANIHGDPVLTNVVVNGFDKLKFIDMRGSFGRGHSLKGDPMYDFAKVYQSLCGYDFVLKNIPIDEDIVTEGTSAFSEMFDEAAMKTIRNIARYLVYTMLPLHSEREPDVLRKFMRLNI